MCHKVKSSVGLNTLRHTVDARSVVTQSVYFIPYNTLTLFDILSIINHSFCLAVLLHVTVQLFHVSTKRVEHVQTLCTS